MNKTVITETVIVVIPIYKSELTRQEAFSIDNTLSVLSNWKVVFMAPYRLKSYIEGVDIIPLGAEQCVFFEDKYFESIDGYNQLLMSRFFYEKFSSYQFMLIVQTDAIVISDQINLWCSKNYSYIGAPWFDGMDKPIRPLNLIGVGNGGFSLRKIEDAILALSVCRYVPNIMVKYKKKTLLNLARYIWHNYIFSFNFNPFLPKTNEDIFWGILMVNSVPEFTVPTVNEAALFSFETCPEYLFELTERNLPFGCHAWEKHNKEFWVDKLNLPKFM